MQFKEKDLVHHHKKRTPWSLTSAKSSPAQEGGYLLVLFWSCPGDIPGSCPGVLPGYRLAKGVPLARLQVWPVSFVPATGLTRGNPPHSLATDLIKGPSRKRPGTRNQGYPSVNRQTNWKYYFSLALRMRAVMTSPSYLRFHNLDTALNGCCVITSCFKVRNDDFRN